MKRVTMVLMLVALSASVTNTAFSSEQATQHKEQGDKLVENVLSAFCVDLLGYPGLNRNGFAWSYLGDSVEQRIDNKGNPIRCMTRSEFADFFGKPADLNFSYYDETKGK
ncbi:hypothetical protein [Vibrio fluvialis]|uniref:hypothetical protein n=1 Tax=Vibrio fluvialis TaxID=676 RepID=UPI003999639E